MSKPDCSGLKLYYDDPFPEDVGQDVTWDEVVCDSYVRVMCADKKIIQIRDIFASMSQLFDVLSSSRSEPAECIHMTSALATSDRIKIICDWLDKHSNFEARNELDYIREEYDRYHFLLNEKGKKKYLTLKDILKVGSNVLSTPTLKPNKKIDFECKMKKIRNKDVSTFTPDELNNTFNTVIMDEIKNILDPFAEVKRSNKYHRKIDELCQLVSVSKFLELHPFKWHQITGESIRNNEINLLSFYPCSQFGYFNIPQRIFCESSFEILLFHIVNYQIANMNSSADLSLMWKTKCQLKIDAAPKITCNTSTKNDLYNIILIYNYFQEKLTPSQKMSFKPVLLPQNHASLSFNINNNSTLLLFYKFYCLNLNNDEFLYEFQVNNIDQLIANDIIHFYNLFSPPPTHERVVLNQARTFKFPFVLNCLLIILAYNSSEGKNQRDYRIAYMDNPDPKKKYVNGVNGELLKVMFEYEDPDIRGPPKYIQVGGPLDKDLIEHWMP
jgi:hypothetical protein